METTDRVDNALSVEVNRCGNGIEILWENGNVTELRRAQWDTLVAKVGEVARYIEAWSD